MSLSAKNSEDYTYTNDEPVKNHNGQKILTEGPQGSHEYH
jgi:hypothetical protein